jgi:hypothetical protein
VSAATSPSQTGGLRRRAADVLEIDRGCLLGGRASLEWHHRLGAVDDLGADDRRKGADLGVVGLDRLIVAHAGDVDLVLGAFERLHQIAEAALALQFGIGLLQPLQRNG